jgi:hypothetical protein
MTPKCGISAGRKTPSLQEPRNEELFLLFTAYPSFFPWVYCFSIRIIHLILILSIFFKVLS